MTATLMGGLGSASLVTESGADGRGAGGGQRLRRRRRCRAAARSGRARFEIGDEFGGLGAGGGPGAAVHPAADEAGAGRAAREHDASRSSRPTRRSTRPGRGGWRRRRRTGWRGRSIRRTRPSTATWSSPSRPARGRRAGPGARAAGSGPCRGALPGARHRPRRPRGAAGAGQPAALLVRGEGMSEIAAIDHGGQPRETWRPGAGNPPAGFGPAGGCAALHLRAMGGAGCRPADPLASGRGGADRHRRSGRDVDRRSTCAC